MNSILIIKDGKINPCFVKANLYLTEHFYQEIELGGNNDQVLKELWQSKFKATLEKHNGYFNKIIFNSSRDLTMFNLRFD